MTLGRFFILDQDNGKMGTVLLKYILKYGISIRSVAEKELRIKTSRTKEVLTEMVNRNLIYLIGKGKNSQYKATK
jgi:phosphopantothenoylcysteine synthetase/decarboxylase